MTRDMVESLKATHSEESFEGQKVCLWDSEPYPCPTILVIEALEDAFAKMKMLADSMETTDGVFAFPDGESIETRKKQ